MTAFEWKAFFVWRVTYICVHVTQAQFLPTSSKHVSPGMRFLGLGIGGLSHQSCMSLHIGTNNIVGGSNIRNVSVTPIWPCVNSKLEVYCEKSLHGPWTCKTDFRYGVVNNGPSNIRKCVEPTGTLLGPMRRAQNGRPSTDAPVVWSANGDKTP